MSTRDAEYKMAKEAQDVFRECITFAMAGQKDRLEGAVNGFLKAHPDMTAPEMVGGFQSEGRTLLHVSASSGHAPVVDFLLGLLPTEARAELINTPDDRGFTPLLNAVIGENDAVTARLIALGGDVKRLNKDDAGCMHFAAGDGSVPRLRLLVDAGADPCPPSKTGGTPLHWAAGKARAAAIEYILTLRSSHGIDIDATAGTGLPAVIMAAGASCDTGVAALVEAGADCGALISGGLTVLHICAENNLLEAARALLATPTGLRCAQLETTDGNRPAHLAAMVGNAEMVALLAPASGAGSAEAILAEGPARLQKWELAHGKQPHSASASAAPGASAQTSDGPAPPRSSRVLEPVTPAASAAAALEAAAHKDRANELFKQKQFALALEEYTRALSLAGDDATYWSNRSACYMALKDAPNALLDAEVCRRLRPDWTKGCFRLAAARLELGLFEDAAVAAFEGLKLDHGNLPLKTLTQEAVRRGKEQYQSNLGKLAAAT